MYWLLICHHYDAEDWEDQYKGQFETLKAAYDYFKSSREYNGYYSACLLQRDKKKDLIAVAHSEDISDHLSDAEVQSRNLPPNYEYRIRKRGWKMASGEFEVMEERLEYEVIELSVPPNEVNRLISQSIATGMYYTPPIWEPYGG